MYFMRIGQMKRERIHPQSRRDLGAESASLLTDSRAADNFRNLFELPVLFYVAILVAAQTDLVTPTPHVLALAWASWPCGSLHSAIQCTLQPASCTASSCYALGGLVLWMLWGCLALGLLTG